MPLGSQWCCSVALACMRRHKACVSWTTLSCWWVMSVDSIRVCHALRRSSEMALISSSPSVMVLSAKGSSSYFSRYSSISWMTRVSDLGHSSFYIHEECSFGRLFVGRLRTGHSIRLWRGIFSTAASS